MKMMKDELDNEIEDILKYQESLEEKVTQVIEKKFKREKLKMGISNPISVLVDFGKFNEIL